MGPRSNSPSWLWRIHEWIGRVLPSTRERRGVGFIIVLLILVLTRDAITFPIAVGWPAAAALIDSEEELARLRQQTSECTSAAAFFRTPEGKTYARKLMYNQLEEGERRVVLVPEPPRDELSATQRVRAWIGAHEAAMAASVHRALRILHRWAFDPPDEEAAAEAAACTKSSD